MSAAFAGTANDGFNVTVDLDNNLKWLDFTFTTFRNFNQINNDLLAPGKPLEGWRYATADDWSNLAISAGVPAALFDTVVPGTPSSPAHEALKDALGRTNNGASVAVTAVTSTTFGSNWHMQGSFGSADSNRDLVEIPNTTAREFGAIRDDNRSFLVGHALVIDFTPQNSIPEPTSIIVWGLLGAVCLKRRRRKV